jgi:hypothetical protein
MYEYGPHWSRFDGEQLPAGYGSAGAGSGPEAGR